MQIKDVSEQHAGTYTLVLRNRLAGLEKHISLQLIVNGKGGQGWNWRESAEPMAPAFGFLQDPVPIAVLKQPTSPLSPPLLRDAVAPVRLLPSGLGDTSFVPGSLTLDRICACSGATSQLQLEMLLRVILTEADLRSGQLPHR